MDAISYSYADKQAKRIKKFINDPDSTSGIVTVPKVIASGENITVPAGRVAVLPNVQVDGTLNVQGEVFIPAGATFGDLESQIDSKQSKSELTYNVNTSSYIANTLSSGAIIERGSNANGEYIKFADGTLICEKSFFTTNQAINSSYGSLYIGTQVWTYPYAFVDKPFCSSSVEYTNQGAWIGTSIVGTAQVTFFVMDIVSRLPGPYVYFKFLAIGKWK